MTSQTPFWLVWCENGGVPHFKHMTEQSAENEASRLARAHPGKSFCVLACTARFTERRLTVERFAYDDGIPF